MSPPCRKNSRRRQSRKSKGPEGNRKASGRSGRQIELTKAEADAKKAKVKAAAEAENTKIKAKAQAEANNELSASITDELIKMKEQKLTTKMAGLQSREPMP